MSRLYVLVRYDLDPVYRMVQGMHAAIEYAAHYGWSEWNEPPTLVICKVNNEFALQKWVDKIKDNDEILYQIFREPDIGNQLTAIAARDDDGEFFKSLEVIKEEL